jgi:hypothetical protein
VRRIHRNAVLFTGSSAGSQRGWQPFDPESGDGTPGRPMSRRVMASSIQYPVDGNGDRTRSRGL